ncbi:penicillin acylase family protein [Mangrovicoccus sp. HB161399]|uniref:penicillin acylase family protein n=1 Tax=Mangrovicoccus sp. HB161399 TaxID=2720392 RepID=UPI0015557094|nr:penicillin acylase family protein [Mangrovicoccus sp. HB161399]
MRRAATALALLAAAAGLAGAAAWVLLQRSLPDYGAELQVAGLAAPVEIRRTPAAVPHIFGESDADVFFGLGYAHAQDRFWQMELFGRTAQGRLSELLGPATLDADELLRRFGLYGAAESSVAVQSPYTRRALDAYSAGINARLAEVPDWGGAAPEFLLFPAEIAPWRPADSLAVMKLLALQLASHVDREVLRARVSGAVPPERLADILPDDPAGGIARMPRHSDLFPGLPGPGSRAALPVPSLSLSASSNAWAAGPGRSASGMPLLANDPHLDFTAPSVFYLARLQLAAGPAIGATIPGLPVILSGRNARLAWGLTAANADDQDVFIERLNPENPREVLSGTGHVPLRIRTEMVQVRGGDPVQLELQWSPNGPVIPGRYHDLAAVTPAGHVAVIARTLYDPSDTSMTAVHRLMQAGSAAEAIGAMEGFVAPAQNLMLADGSGIALQLVGRVPKRRPGHATLGRMPAPGWVEENRWDGMLDYARNPRFADPESGILGNTNNKTVDRPFPWHISFDWGDTQRILRLQDVMAARGRHDLASFAAAQGDAVSVPAQVLVPLLARTLGPLEGPQAEAMALLSAWDGAMLPDRPEPLIFAAWMRAFQQALAGDELGALAGEFTHANPVFLERVLRGTGGAAAWCDDISTSRPETCADAAAASLGRTLDALARDPGGPLAEMRWGGVHLATHDHPVLGGLPLLGWAVNLRHASGGGDNTLLRGLTRGSGPDPLQNRHGAVYREAIDLGDPESSVFVISTGQSGHPLSRHYRDLSALWREGRYLPMALDPGSGGPGAAVTRLLPR